ncbi:MAG: hypothetical protein NZ744_03995 [Pirellulaceae bacterium]|nr:hypothetical protein [Pirellulaceae bacterium]
MSTYLLTCECGLDIPVQVAQAGDQLTCSCGSRIAVPNLRDVKQLTLADVQLDKPKREWNAVSGSTFAIAIVFIALGLAVAAYNYSIGKQLITTDTTAAAHEYGNIVIDQMPPFESIEIFAVIVGRGLGEQQTVDFLVEQKKQTSFYDWAKGGLILSAIGLLLVFVPIVLNRTKS